MDANSDVGPGAGVAIRVRNALGDAVHEFPWGGAGLAGWHFAFDDREVPGRQGCREYVLCATPESEAVGACAGLVLTVPTGPVPPYVLAPAMVYDGNRFEVVDVPYSPFWPDASHYAIDKAPCITNQPHLTRDAGRGSISLDSHGLATPCLGARTAAGLGWLLLAERDNELGPVGLTLEEEPEHLRLVAWTPRARPRVPGSMGFQPADEPVPWPAGRTVTLRVRMWLFEAPRLQVLFDRFAGMRKDFGSTPPGAVLPFSAAARMVRDKLNARNWDEALGYYRHGISRENAKPFDWWQLGWVSGGITTLPMLADGDGTARERAMRNLEFLFNGSPVPNGLWRAHHDGTKWNSDDPRPPKPGYQVSVRRLGDGLYYGLKQLHLLRQSGVAVPRAWEDSVRNLAAALVRVFEAHGQLGQYLDIRSGDILLGGTTAGGGVSAGLVLASLYFHDPAWLGHARRIGAHFVEQSVARGVTTGGPCDALSAPDSESCFALIVSLVELHEATGDAAWARAASDLVRQFATWVTTGDVVWPPDSAMGRAGVPACGTVWANVQNKHAAPGICTYSGEHLFRLWRATGDEFALDLLTDIARALPHYVSRPERPIGPLDPGMMCERVNISDWEGRGAVGGNVFGSTIWVETAMLLTAAELPGVYVRTDTGRVVVLDHVEADWSGAGLRLRNPTGADAVVRVLAETEAAAAAPLAVWARGVSISVPAQGEVLVDAAMVDNGRTAR